MPELGDRQERIVACLAAAGNGGATRVELATAFQFPGEVDHAISHGDERTAIALAVLGWWSLGFGGRWQWIRT